jgi:hypothetical protein
MPGQIPGALGVLSKFLSEENTRLDQEIKERDTRQTIDYAATEFSKIGPDATPQDVRNVYYKALTFASDNKTEETIPMLSGLFSESAQFVRQTKLDRQDQALVDILGQKTGMDLGGLSGPGATGVANYDAQTTQFFTTQTEEGKSFAQAYKLQGGQFKPVEQKIDIILSTFDRRADAQRRGQRYTGSQPNLVKSLKETPGGQELHFYPQLGTAGGYYVQNEQTGQLEKYVGPTQDRQNTLSTIRARSFREAETNLGVQQGMLQGSGKTFAALLTKFGSKDVPATSLFKNINSDEYRKETFSTLRAYQNAGELDDLIYGNEEKDIRPAPVENQAVLLEAYESFVKELNAYEMAQQDMDKFSGNTPGNTQVEGAPRIVPPGTQDLISPHQQTQLEEQEAKYTQTSTYARNIFNGTTESDKIAQQHWQNWIRVNLRIPGVTSLDQLDANQTKLFLDYVMTTTGIN